MFFDKYEQVTIEDCKAQLTEDELRQLQECGQHIIVRPDYYKFGDSLPEDLLSKVNSLFHDWLESQIRHKVDINGLVVEVEVLPQELEARKNYPDFFSIYFKNEEIKDDKSLEALYRQSRNYEITGLYLTFIQALGIEIHFEPEATDIEAITDTQPGNVLRIVFDENTAQLQVTHKNYSGALSPRKNKYAYIVDLDNQLRFTWDKDGTPIITTADEQQAYNDLLSKKVIPAKCADTDLLATLGAAVKAAYMSNVGDRITVYLPNFAKALGVQFDKDTSDKNHYDFWGKIKQLENIGGVLVEQGKILRAFVFLGYDKTENSLTFASPYLYSLMDILKNNPKVSKQKKDNKPLYSFEGISYLIDAKIITARSKITSEIVKNLVAGLFQHGIKTDAARNPHKQLRDKRLVTWSITYRDLIRYTPLLKEYLQETETKRRSQNYKRVVFGESYNERSKKQQVTLVEKYLREYTDAFQYWCDLSITVEPVSMKLLDNKIILSHHGLNGDFKERLHIPRVESQDNVLDES